MNGVLAIDYGERRVGIAYGYEDLKVAIPLPFLDNNNVLIEEISQLITTKEIIKILVGEPLSLKGKKTQKTIETEAFYLKLKDTFSISIEKIDERLSSVEANKVFKSASISTKRSRNLIDSSAACILLNQYFNTIKLR